MRNACFDIWNEQSFLPLPKPLWAGPLRLSTIALCNYFSLVMVLLFLFMMLLNIDILISPFLFRVTYILQCSKSRVHYNLLLLLLVLRTQLFGLLLVLFLSLFLDYFDWWSWTFFFYKCRYLLFFIDCIFFIDDEFLPFFFRCKWWCRVVVAVVKILRDLFTKFKWVLLSHRGLRLDCHIGLFFWRHCFFDSRLRFLWSNLLLRWLSDLDFKILSIEGIKHGLVLHELNLKVLVRFIMVGDQIVDGFEEWSQWLAVVLLLKQKLFFREYLQQVHHAVRGLST